VDAETMQLIDGLNKPLFICQPLQGDRMLLLLMLLLLLQVFIFL
jgi:hypothetical protein